MEIGLSSASFYPFVKTEDSIRLMKELGFNSGEIFLNSESEYKKEFIKKLIEEKEKYNFRVNSVHGFSSSFETFLFDAYERRREDMFTYFKEVCKAGKLLGADCYTFHGMKNINSFNMNFIKEIYDKLTYTAGEIGIKIAQENVSRCMSSRPDFLEYIRNNCRYPIFFTLDIKQAYKAGLKPEAYINIMGDKMVNFHVNDIDKNRMCLLPGQGEVDYEELSCKFKEIGYNRICIIEVYSDNYISYEQLSKCREFLKKYY